MHDNYLNSNSHRSEPILWEETEVLHSQIVFDVIHRTYNNLR